MVGACVTQMKADKYKTFKSQRSKKNSLQRPERSWDNSFKTELLV
jgi:hypothetical protein